MSGRALSPVLGVVCLLVVTAVLAGVVGTFALGVTPPSNPPTAALDLRIDADANELTFVHRAGDSLDVRELSLRVRIDGTPLDTQPPVPFFSARDFKSGPTGPFNTATDSTWEAGERASFRVAETNDPALAPGAHVTVKIVVENAVVAEVDETA
ncbi:type IV pilin N-terminal domain-containing protein [Halorussus amylolyticus]|uniref:type IV pilin N-terminal domain-containing protein n=1 Tax=Halorussus amylolyticus TaxID=1126242 RepID=UPI001052DEED|nr:type IV pilin N-terminal domain-containing protein [Halorussus amylolyticus]